MLKFIDIELTTFEIGKVSAKIKISKGSVKVLEEKQSVLNRKWTRLQNYPVLIPETCKISCNGGFDYRTRANKGRSRLVAAPLRNHAKMQFLCVFYVTI